MGRLVFQRPVVVVDGRVGSTVASHGCVVGRRTLENGRVVPVRSHGCPHAMPSRNRGSVAVTTTRPSRQRAVFNRSRDEKSVLSDPAITTTTARIAPAPSTTSAASTNPTRITVRRLIPMRPTDRSGRYRTYANGGVSRTQPRHSLTRERLVTRSEGGCTIRSGRVRGRTCPGVG